MSAGAETVLVVGGTGVPHFWNKALAERYLTDQGVRYVSLRPAAFFDQIMDLLPAGGLRRGRLISAGPPHLRQSYVLSTDVAAALAALVDAPVTDGEHIDLGWDRPVSMDEIAAIAGPVLDRKVRMLTIPAPLLNGILGVAGRISQQAADLRAMIEYFGTGRFVADTARQRELLGPVPTAERAIHHWATSTPLTR